MYPYVSRPVACEKNLEMVNPNNFLGIPRVDLVHVLKLPHSFDDSPNFWFMPRSEIQKKTQTGFGISVEAPKQIDPQIQSAQSMIIQLFKKFALQTIIYRW